MIKRTIFSSLALLSVLVACSGGAGTTTSGGPGTSSGGPGAFTFTLADATAAPAGTKVVVIWSVSSGSPDYVYAFGSGTQSGNQVSVSFSGNPPAEALNAGVIGIGFVVAVDAGANIPEGKVVDFHKSMLRAISAHHAIIYRASAMPAVSNGWDVSFPQGFACGKCVERVPDSGTSFDSFAVEDCSKVVLMSADADVCNWT